MAKKKECVPEYGSVVRKGIRYYRTRITDADGKRVDLYAETCEELYQKEQEARRQVEEAIFQRESHGCGILREVAVDAVGKDFTSYIKRLHD